MGSLPLKARVDCGSFQVSAPSDARFWFRLERGDGCDVITDFFVGAQPEQRGAELLALCYQALGLRPQATLVFRDLLPRSSGSQADGLAGELDSAQHHFAVSGKCLLRRHGASRVDEQLLNRNGKYDLVLRVAESRIFRFPT